MGCYQGNPQTGRRQHHHDLGHAGQFGEEFGMSGK